MALLVFILSIIFTLLATAILAYVSMVSMIGPWLAPTISLLGSFVIRRLYPKSSNHATQHHVAILQAIAAGGGTIAVGVGFALPMLYFLDSALFAQLLTQPLLFISLIGLIVVCAGSLGIFLGSQFSEPLIITQQLPFPSSRLTFNVIHAQGQKLQTNLLTLGATFASFVCFLRDGFLSFVSVIPKTITFAHLSGNEISLAISPMLGAIGFFAGIHIALPLLVGFICKLFIFTLLQSIFQFFFQTSGPSISSMAMGFCSGLLLAEIIGGLHWITYIKNLFYHKSHTPTSWSSFAAATQAYKSILCVNWKVIKYGSFILFINSIFLLYAGFGFFASLLFLLLTCIATYHICIISGHIGMVQFGRFSTFIMIPMLLLFSLSPLHLTLICLFFHICAASASDYLFDYNIFHLGNYSKKNLALYQLLGLVITAWSLGFILWLLFTNFELGSPELFAQRGKTKALLLQSLSFDFYTLALGFFYGLVLKKLRISPAMTLGGLLMPPSLVLSLLTGSLMSAMPSQKDRYAPLCAGILAGESMWVIFSIMTRFF